ncbi:MAG: hypothetical protein JSW49_04505 [candidate division WOR-3 bacterium]|nr:MAG: hypothetical protein JSW49_04505 [candidate division WOR-3 bacterium]
MKRLSIILLLLLMVGLGEAALRKSSRRPFIELGPKASLYIGSVGLGLGAEVVVNPLRNIGLRMDIAELYFGDRDGDGEGDTQFYFNLRNLTVDGILYIPMSGIKPYAFFGIGVAADGRTDFDFRSGMGFNYSVTSGTDLFFEPGIIVSYNSARDETDVWFRFSFGGRLGIIR